jgi:Replication protein P
MSQILDKNQWLIERKNKDTGLEFTLMDRLFDKFQAMYLRRWNDQFNSKQMIENWKNDWAKSFEQEKITQNMIANGINNCLKMYDYPPSLPQFLKACKGFDESLHRRLAMADEQYANDQKRLTDVVSREKAEENIEKLKKMMQSAIKTI